MKGPARRFEEPEDDSTASPAFARLRNRSSALPCRSFRGGERLLRGWLPGALKAPRHAPEASSPCPQASTPMPQRWSSGARRHQSTTPKAPKKVPEGSDAPPQGVVHTHPQGSPFEARQVLDEQSFAAFRDLPALVATPGRLRPLAPSPRRCMSSHPRHPSGERAGVRGGHLRHIVGAACFPHLTSPRKSSRLPSVPSAGRGIRIPAPTTQRHFPPRKPAQGIPHLHLIRHSTFCLRHSNLSHDDTPYDQGSPKSL